MAATILASQLAGAAPALAFAGTVTVSITDPSFNAPIGVAVTPDGSSVYVTNRFGNSVSVIDVATNSVTASITDPGLNIPFGVAVTPNGSSVYVTNELSDWMSVIDVATNTVTATIPGLDDPLGVAVTPDGSSVYATNGDNSVAVIDVATNTVLTTITDPGFNGPAALAVTPDGSTVYVTNRFGNSVSVIDVATNSVTATITGFSSPFGVAVTPDGSSVYVTNTGPDSVSVIDVATNAVTTTITDPGLSAAFGLAVTPDGSSVYVTNTTGNSVSVIDVGKNVVTATITDSSFDTPVGVAVTPDGRSVYVGNELGDSVSVITRVPPRAPAPPPPSVSVASSRSPSHPGDPVTFTATLSPVPLCGSVSWLIDNMPVEGVATSGSDGTFTLGPTTLPVGVHPVTAVFSGCASAGSASGTVNQQVVEPPPVVDPTISAQLGSAHPKRHGWYRSPVHVTFTCTPGSAPLTEPCPDPVVLRRSGAGQGVTRSVTATDGGSANVEVGGIDIDRDDPTLHVRGARTGKLYHHGRRLHCVAHDSLSGVAKCVVHRHARGRDGIRHVHWKAIAKDTAGNKATKHGHFRIK